MEAADVGDCQRDAAKHCGRADQPTHSRSHCVRDSEPANLPVSGRMAESFVAHVRVTRRKEIEQKQKRRRCIFFLYLLVAGRRNSARAAAPCDWHASQSEAMRSVRNGFECAVRALPLWWLQLLCCAHQAIGNDNMRPRSGGKWRSSLPILPSFARPRPLRIKRHARFIDDRATRLSRAGRWRCYRHGG